MQKVVRTIASIKSSVERLKGQSVDMRVDYGRKRIVNRRGVIDSTYPAVFTVIMEPGELANFSYTDILCGTLVISQRSK